jgi:hypothetical protein
MKTRIAQVFAALFLIAFLQAVWAQDSAATGELVVIDLRPKEEKDGVGLTELAGKCNKNVFRIADVATDPLKVKVLKSDLSRSLGLAADGKTLTVLNWSIYYNMSAGSSRPTLGNIGVQGYAIPGKKKEKQQGSKCSRGESAGGWYAAGDVTTSAPPLVSEFEGTFAGKPYTIRAVYSPRRKIEGRFEGAEDDTAALLEAVHMTAEALATAIVQ